MKRENKDVKVLLSRQFPERGIEMMRNEGFELTVWEEDRPMTQKELIEKARSHTALLCTLSEKIDKTFLDECRHLDIISQFGVGYDNIDVDQATRQGIHVGNTPGVLSDATADVAFGLMINVARKMFYLHKSISKGEWNYFRPNANLGIELKNRTLGIFGLGRIGLEMAKRCKGAYNMEVIYHNRSKKSEAEREIGARYVGFDELIENSDVLSVHASLSKETYGRFDKEVFGRMKSSAIFINTARGSIHNEEDLINALDKGIIWGAGLDVTNPEPMAPSNPLLNMENVAVLPHIGSATVETRNKMSELAALNIIELYRGNEIPNLVNPGVLKTGSAHSHAKG
jgi:glyoxylate reductase